MNWLNQELSSPCIAGIKYVDPFDNFRQKRTQSNDTLSMVCLRDKHPHNRKMHHRRPFLSFVEILERNGASCFQKFEGLRDCFTAHKFKTAVGILYSL